MMPRRTRPSILFWPWTAGAFLVLIAVLAWSIAWPSGLQNVMADEPIAQTWIPLEPQIDVVWLTDFENGPYIGAHAAILFENNTGTVLYAKNPHQTRAPASTTKILTALLALEMTQPDEIVTVSRKAAGTHGSSARLYTGQKIRMHDLLHGLLLNSGNDAATAIAEHIAGSEEEFSRLMNAWAHQLGATHSRFVNAHGLDKPGHFSTAYDLALLSRAALLYPEFQEIVAKRTYQYEGGSWQNTNQLLWRYEGLEGIKTGTTGQAGYCLVAAASQDGMQLISVVLGSTNRWRDTTTLLDYGFENFHRVTLANRGEALATLPIGGRVPVVAVSNRPISVIVRDEDVAHITTQMIVEENLRAPIHRGQQLGVFNIYVDGELAKSIPLTARDSVERPTIFGQWWSSLTTLFKPAEN